MADDPPAASRVSDELLRDVKEDAETAATREELANTQVTDISRPASDTEDDMKLRSGTDYVAPVPKTRKKISESKPVVKAVNEASLRDQIASPKKKRQHDQVDGSKAVSDSSEGSGGEDSHSEQDGNATKRIDRSEPEKKRPRDENSPPPTIHAKSTEQAPANDTQPTTNTKEATVDGPTTTPSAFASSGFAKLASSTQSPFASFGTGGASPFGAPAGNPLSSFSGPLAQPASAPAPAPTAPKLNFDKGVTASPFAAAGAQANGFGGINGGGGLGGSVFGSAFGQGGFGAGGGGGAGAGGALGGALNGNTAGGFGTPGLATPFKTDKPAKEFGAPDSDAEDEDEDDTTSGVGGEDGVKCPVDGKGDTNKEESKPVEDEKRVRLKKVDVDDGEAGEVSILVVRGRMFYLDKSTGPDDKVVSSWKERGAGMLKINVPMETLDIDEDTGEMDPDSFSLEALTSGTLEASKVVRFIMRQDSTHRVLLNTVLLKNAKFELKESLKSSSVLFTAIEGDGKAISVQMRMNHANAKEFTGLVDYIQKGLTSGATKS